MKPEAAAETLQKALDPSGRDFTVADAAAASGLSLRDAEAGLHALTSEYRGHLKATEEGEILFRFPHGFTKPWETTTALRAALHKVGAWLSGAARFVVRAWVSIVLVGYVVIFVAILIALMFSKSEDRDGGRLGWLAYALFRLVGEALFWTFHPFSPFAVGGYDELRPRSRSRSGGWKQGWVEQDQPQAPFYQRVDQFFFGPKPAPEDPNAPMRAVLAEIRAGKGRIGLADVMRVTGQPRDVVDPMMSRLMLDYGGSVEVSEEGGIAYRFPDLRKTVEERGVRRAPPIWARREEVPPITGNPSSSDLLIGALNGFNLVMSGWVLATGLTIERMIALFTQTKPELIPPPGLPIVLGVIPFVFSFLLFLIPLARLALRGRKVRAVQRENGRRALLQGVLESTQRGGVSDDELKQRYRVATGVEPSDKEITAAVVALGGDVDLDQAAQGIRYRFKDLELEAKAVQAERDAASEEEAKVGKVVFSSED
ncbi:MAG: hypothetical protein IPM79_24650 [Polyangiaceae bacterium]|jgi:hypothetical protein|nr:hypothetical protein [Polyangiaceae bacterium]MBK8940719.1 hypothetical protein [Polyangiaceae bacterium]